MRSRGPRAADLFGPGELDALVARAQDDHRDARAAPDPKGFRSDAWERLYGVYIPHGLAQLNRVLESRMDGVPILDEFERSDIVTDALYKSVLVYDPARGAFGTLLAWQMLYYAKEVGRKRCAAKRTPCGVRLALGAAEAEAVPDDRDVIDPEVSVRVDEYVENMEASSVERIRADGEMLRLRFWDETPMDQIAARYGVVKQTMYTRYRDALARLRPVFDVYA